MRTGPLLRLAVAGTRTDTLRLVLTAFSAALGTLALLAIATVLSIQQENTWHYSPALFADARIRAGVALGLLLLTIPVLALAAACSRLGAPARDRRLAALRLAGATPGQVRQVAAAETGVASLAGSVAGLALYWAIMLGYRPGVNEQMLVPTDVRLGPLLTAALCLLIPLGAAALAPLMLRRVAVTPFGVARRTVMARPRPWPVLLIAAGVAAFLPLERLAWVHGLPSWVEPALIFGGGLVASAGVALCVGWIARTAGRLLHRFGRTPAVLIAARRLLDDPWSGARTFGALLVAVLFGAGAAAFRSVVATRAAIQEEHDRIQVEAMGERWVPGLHPSDTLTLDTVDLAVWVGATVAGLALLVSLVERIVAGRRGYAALVATGVPWTVLARATIWQVLAQGGPAVLVAVVVGAAAVRGSQVTTVRAGGSVRQGGLTPAGAPNGDLVWLPTIVRAVPVPWVHLTGIAVGASLLMVAVVALSLTTLRSATDLVEVRTA